MKKHIVFLSSILVVISCKPRKTDSERSNAKAFETYKVNPNEPATLYNKTSCASDVSPQTCAVWLYYHPKVGDRTSVSKTFDESKVEYDPIYINQSGKIAFQTFPSTCSLESCIDIAKAYFKTGYLKADSVTYQPVAVQYEYNDGFVNDSDGVVCLISTDAKTDSKVESLVSAKAGRNCTVRIVKP